MIKPALTVAAAVIFGLSACAPARHKPSGSEVDLSAIQGKLFEAEEKIDQLTQRVTLMQIIVDSHQQTLQDLAGDSVAGDVDADLNSAYPAPETETASTSNQTSAPAFQMEIAAPVSETTSSAPSSEPQEVKSTQPPETGKKLTIPEPNPQYQTAMKMFRSEDYETAADLFEKFARQFPENDLADNALYWSGECRYTRKDYTGALKQFRQVIEDYPSGSKAPDALLKIGFAYLSLGDKESAIAYLKKVVAQYPFSTAGSKAEERLETLQK